MCLFLLVEHDGDGLQVKSWQESPNAAQIPKLDVYFILNRQFLGGMCVSGTRVESHKIVHLAFFIPQQSGSRKNGNRVSGNNQTRSLQTLWSIIVLHPAHTAIRASEHRAILWGTLACFFLRPLAVVDLARQSSTRSLSLCRIVLVAMSASTLQVQLLVTKQLKLCRAQAMDHCSQ